MLNTQLQPIRHDGELVLSQAPSMTSKHWKNGGITLSGLVEKLKRPHVTSETRAEFSRMSREDQLRLKDSAGGFVGGPVNGKRRTRQSVPFRQLVSLDADFAGETFLDNLLALTDFCAIVHTTRKHRPEAPKYRILIPLDRPVNFEEYQAISRRLAQQMGMPNFDHTCFQFERLMFWPTVSSGDEGNYRMEFIDEPWLSADEVLDTYRRYGGTYMDVSLWPMSDHEVKAINLEVRKAGDPKEKPGLIGAFCRAYSIEEGIAEFLSDVYTPAGEGRWTYVNGSSAAGVWLVPDAEYIKSFHGTDPVGAFGRPACLWDAVRIHRYGELDGALEGDEDPSKLLSHQRMLEWVRGLDRVRAELLHGESFDVIPEETEGEEEPDWRADLAFNDKGKLEPTIDNVRIILTRHERLKGRLRYNEFTGDLDIKDKLPWSHGPVWTDTDTNYLKMLLERYPYMLKKRDVVDAAIDVAAKEQSYHPVQDYLNKLVWDGRHRVEDCLVRYFGADDTPYTRLVARKFFVGAVARVMEPGVKWDNVLVLTGAQGAGKSTFAQRIAKGWHTDSLVSMQGKDGMESVQGRWIVELSELSAMKKSDLEHTKAFVASQSDKFRPAYGRRVICFPRQCVFVGTTNEAEFLKDLTGNRRWWPVTVRPERAKEVIFDALTPKEVDQLWAEARQLWALGEELFLTAEESRLAQEVQDKHVELPPVAPIIEQWLDSPVPVNWHDMGQEQRLMWEGQGDTVRLDQVSAIEVWYHALRERNRPQRHELAEIKSVLYRMGWEPAKNLLRTPWGRQRYYTRRKADESTAGQSS